MKLQQLLSYTRKAVDEYAMIEDGDHIAVGISGGKDSLTLLYALNGLRRFYPKHFELSAVTVDLGYENYSEPLCASIYEHKTEAYGCSFRILWSDLWSGRMIHHCYQCIVYVS